MENAIVGSGFAGGVGRGRVAGIADAYFGLNPGAAFYWSCGTTKVGPLHTSTLSLVSPEVRSINPAVQPQILRLTTPNLHPTDEDLSAGTPGLKSAWGPFRS